MKSEKSRSGIAAFLFTLCVLIFAALALGAMFVFKDMMRFLLIYGTFIAPVVITLLFVFIDRMEHRLSANGSPAMIIIFVAHAVCLAIVSPVLSCTLGWPIMGFEEYSLGEQIAGSVIVSIFCGGIVFAIADTCNSRILNAPTLLKKRGNASLCHKRNAFPFLT